MAQMNVGNLAAVFAPNLLRPEQQSIEHLADTAHIVNLVAILITSRCDLFPDLAMTSRSASRSSQPHEQFSSAHAVPGDNTLQSESTNAAFRDEPCSWYFLDDEHVQHGPVRVHRPPETPMPQCGIFFDAQR